MFNKLQAVMSWCIIAACASLKKWTVLYFLAPCEHILNNKMKQNWEN